MYIRKTEEADIKDAANIYSAARKFMIENGNPDQWKSSTPDERQIRADMKEDASFVCVDEDEITAIFYFKKGPDPTYENIECGEWLSELRRVW